MKSGEIDTAPGALQCPCEVHGDLRHRLEHRIQSFHRTADRDRLRQKSSAGVAPARMVEVAGPGHSTKRRKGGMATGTFLSLPSPNLPSLVTMSRIPDVPRAARRRRQRRGVVLRLVGSELRLASALEKHVFLYAREGRVCIVLISVNVYVNARNCCKMLFENR